MKYFTILAAILVTSFNTNAQDIIFGGPSFRFENTAIGFNAGYKKDFGNFGAMAQVTYYPNRLETDNSVTELYYTYTNFTLTALYNFQLENEMTIYPIAGLAINTRRSKARVKSIFEPDVERDFSRGKRQNTTGITIGVGAIKPVGNINLIGDFRYDATEYNSLRLSVGIAYIFGNSKESSD